MFYHHYPKKSSSDTIWISIHWPTSEKVMEKVKENCSLGNSSKCHFSSIEGDDLTLPLDSSEYLVSFHITQHIVAEETLQTH